MIVDAPALYKHEGSPCQRRTRVPSDPVVIAAPEFHRLPVHALHGRMMLDTSEGTHGDTPETSELCFWQNMLSVN